MKLKNVTLELSSKPFYDESEDTMYSVCRKMFTQWKPLTDHADMVSVMLWIADGSEIFEYSGNLDQKFEWAYWCGCANPIPPRPDVTEREKLNTFSFPTKYRPDAAPRPYSWLKRLIEVIRETGSEISGKPIRIGATYDNGPEFAISKFKYQTHREIAQGHTIFPNSVVSCTAKFHADSTRYAAFPEGIPEGTSVGTFLAAQFKEFARDLGYDYLWLSNGMGFGTETWGITGMLFDKMQFYPDRAKEAADKMLKFWHDFFAAYPDCAIETRGSNYSAGTEISTDACPFRELYGKYKIAPPVNSPWAALNFNTGLEITAWMSHVAELPDDRFPFRFYIHDPWFCNSPYLDRYGREPWDLFQPLSVGRLDAQGKTTSANRISFLSVDDTWGRMPDQVPAEVIPLLQDAFDNAPDAPGPLVWVYPFEEYSELVRGNDPHPEIVFTEDMFIGECVQQGLPLNTVISTGNFRELILSGKNHLEHSILIVPVSAADKNMDVFKRFFQNGGKVIFYGSLSGASTELNALLGVENAEPLSGQMSIQNNMPADEYCNCTVSDTVYVHPQFACGGITEVPASGSEQNVRAWAVQDDKKRIAVIKQSLKNGAEAGFVRAILPSSDTVQLHHRNFDYGKTGEIYPAPALMRDLLAEYNWKIRCLAYEKSTLLPRTTISRSRNAFFFSVFAPDTTAEMHVNTPYGAPILTEMETRLDQNGNAVWHPGKSWHKECRCFVKQSVPSVIKAKIQHQSLPCYTDELFRRNYSGFVDAEVRIFIDESVEGDLEIITTPTECGDLLRREPAAYELERTASGLCAVLKHVTGCLYITKFKKGILPPAG